MLFQYTFPDIYVELIFLFKYLAIILIFYFSLMAAKRIKEAGIFSANTGFVFFLFSLGIFQFGNSMIIISNYKLLGFFLAIQLVLGILLFIIFSEIDRYKHIQSHNLERIRYPLSIITLILIAIFLPLTLLGFVDDFLGYSLLVIPFMFALLKFIRKFSTLEMIKKSRPEIWLLTGLILSGYSNFLYHQDLVSLVGLNIIFVVQKVFFIIGVMMMVWGWNRLPNLSELDWLKKIERILIIHTETSLLLYQHDFQIEKGEPTAIVSEGHLVGSAIGGVDMLLKEILSSEGRIKEIDHGGKHIYFNHGLRTTAILISKGASDEFRYRLEMMQLNFEKLFLKDLEKWNGAIDQFSKSKDLIRQHFLQ